MCHQANTTPTDWERQALSNRMVLFRIKRTWPSRQSRLFSGTKEKLLCIYCAKNSETIGLTKWKWYGRATIRPMKTQWRYIHFRRVIKLLARHRNEINWHLHLQALKGAGMSFRVSSNPDIETHADFRVPSMKSITSILQWLQRTMS